MSNPQINLNCRAKALVYICLPFFAAKEGIENAGKAKNAVITGLALLAIAAVATAVVLGVPQVNHFVGKGISWLNGHGVHGVTGMYMLYGAAGLAGAGYITWLAIRCVQQHKVPEPKRPYTMG
ncbi:MAG: hypothetical protein K940chlam9_00945 [Chlamydiae bacterium]|nr:hypothetical protein [Chlamydiota bacterium]